METTVLIRHFKSIRELEFEAKRINVFIGEPNSGKTNILEGLALSALDQYHEGFFRDILRVRQVSDCFFEQNINSRIEVRIGNRYATFGYEGFERSSGDYFRYSLLPHSGKEPEAGTNFLLTNQFEKSDNHSKNHLFRPIQFYRFNQASNQKGNSLKILEPPFGQNLSKLLGSNKELRHTIGSLLEDHSISLFIKPLQDEIGVGRFGNGDNFIYPFESLSETLRKLIFYIAAIESNSNSILLFDEPEAGTFPFYTKYLAEKIARQSENTFFVTTHNPYMLENLIEKTPVDDLAVYICKMVNNQTVIHRVKGYSLVQLITAGVDVFFNIDYFFNLNE